MTQTVRMNFWNGRHSLFAGLWLASCKNQESIQFTPLVRLSHLRKFPANLVGNNKTTMVVQGDLEVRLVNAQTKIPFPEHVRGTESYVEVELHGHPPIAGTNRV